MPSWNNSCKHPNIGPCIPRPVWIPSLRGSRPWRSPSNITLRAAGGIRPERRAAACFQALGRAVLQAEEEVGEFKAMQGALGMGAGRPGANDTQAMADLFRRVRNLPSVRRICTAGWQIPQRGPIRTAKKTLHGADELVGVTLGGEPGAMFPQDWPNWRFPELESGHPSSHGRTLGHVPERSGVEPVGKGPILVVVDESGSMEGEKVETARRGFGPGLDCPSTTPLVWVNRL